MRSRSLEYPQVHVRTALHLLCELERQLRIVGLVMPEHYHLFRLLGGCALAVGFALSCVWR